MRQLSFPMYLFTEMPEMVDIHQATLTWCHGLMGHLKAMGFEDIVWTQEANTSFASLHEIWQSPNLLLSQTCGLPLIQHLQDKVTVIGSPIYDVRSNETQVCEASPGHYHSVIVTTHEKAPALLAALESQEDAVQQQRPAIQAKSPPSFPGTFAINEQGSLSGYGLLLEWLDEHHWQPRIDPQSRIITGSHTASIQTVASGQADCASIDATTYALILQEYPPLVESLIILDRTRSAPSLPWITHRHITQDERSRLWQAIIRAFQDPALEQARQTLMLKGIQETDIRQYQQRIASLNRFGIPTPGCNRASAAEETQARASSSAV